MFSYFRSNKLPKCDLEMKPSKLFVTECIINHNYEPTSNYINFIQQLENYIGGDCWAIVVNGNIIFNSYEDKSIREQIIDENIRTEIMNGIHYNIFANFFREEKDAVMNIYMFCKESYCINVHFEINYSETESRFTIDLKQTQAHFDKFENEFESDNDD